MGLKSDIKKAFLDNIKPADSDWQPTKEGNDKLDALADDLSLSIRDFILAQTFRVDKLNASTGPVKTLPGATSAGVTMGAPGPHSVPPIAVPPIPIGILTVEVDKDGQADGNLNSGPQSNYSEVRLRKDQVKGM